MLSEEVEERKRLTAREHEETFSLENFKKNFFLSFSWKALVNQLTSIK